MASTTGPAAPRSERSWAGAGAPQVEAALAGDRAALERLLAALRPRFVRFVLRQTGDAELAEETAQEALVKIFERLGDVREERAFEGWAYQVLSNALRDHFRRSRRFSQMKERLAEALPHSTPLQDPARWAAHSELTALVGWAMSRLDEKHRLVLQMHEIDGLEHAEIARLLNLPEGTVWSRLHYARRMLREMLKEAQ